MNLPGNFKVRIHIEHCWMWDWGKEYYMGEFLELIMNGNTLYRDKNICSLTFLCV